MSALISRDSTGETAETIPSDNSVLPRELIYKLDYDKLPILSMNSILQVQVDFEYKSSTPYDAYISLRDVDKSVPEATWRVKDLMTDKLVGFLATTDRIHIANGTEWRAKYSWFKSAPHQPSPSSTPPSNSTVNP